ncbi:hypothetical protein J416_12939 [Gracilibacillus halophilus YIM-C55.5]|uniref:Uncharacterized protein n=1 Tax=Gracilibacillus halophilus YIM-C55.5 TaxID=1308866 RepID=N4W729_9BACI|nr:hypothetical protein [Gracilibacillus halophilus]ENH96033.1 hypothetical protein J416_12939 [Gracilibacillus halophilus YIM-C55.5]
MMLVFAIFSFFALFIFNSLTYRLCMQTEMSQEKQPNVFRTINILITILLVSSYVEVVYT